MKKIALASKILLSIMILGGVGRYFFMYGVVVEEFLQLGHPAHIVIPLGICKLLGIVVLWRPFHHELTIAAFTAFFFNFQLATAARAVQGDPKVIGSIVTTIFLGIIYYEYMSQRKERAAQEI